MNPNPAIEASATEEPIRQIDARLRAAVEGLRPTVDPFSNLVAFTVATLADKRSAAESIKGIKAVKKQVVATRDLALAPIKTLHDARRADFGALVTTLDDVDKHLRNETLQFDARQRAEAERLQRIAEAEAAQRAAEAAAREREARERAAEAQAAAEQAPTKLAAIPMRRAALEAEAEALAAAADARAATVVPVIEAAPQKVDGIATRRVLRFEITDESQIPDAFWKRVLDEAAIRRHGIDTEAKVPVPGIRFFYDEIVVA